MGFEGSSCGFLFTPFFPLAPTFFAGSADEKVTLFAVRFLAPLEAFLDPAPRFARLRPPFILLLPVCGAY